MNIDRLPSLARCLVDLSFTPITIRRICRTQSSLPRAGSKLRWSASESPACENHLQTIEQRRERRRPTNVTRPIALNVLNQTNTTDRFRVKSFRSQKQQRKSFVFRRIDILLANVLSRSASIASPKFVAFRLLRDRFSCAAASGRSVPSEIWHRSATRLARRSRRRGNLIANSTRSSVSSCIFMFLANCSGVSIRPGERLLPFAPPTSRLHVCEYTL